MPNLINNPRTLAGEDQERLDLLLDAALQVRDKKQFYVWAQRELQYLLSHEIMVCCISGGKELAMKYYKFSSTPDFTRDNLAELCHPQDGLVSQMMQHSEMIGTAIIVDPETSLVNFDEDWVAILKRHGLVNVVAHGVKDSYQRMKSYFCFFRVNEKLGERTGYLLDILLPILDSTLSRVTESVDKGDDLDAFQQHAGLLGKRHLEILIHIKAGKSNKEIGQLLGLSPMTIKNHVQKIMKNLNVNTRGHAVIQAINFGLLNHRE